MARNVARFLLPDPPREPWHLSRLFVNRERELARALEQLAAVRKDDLGRPMAIVGQARVGKSHLLQQIVRRVRRKFDATVTIHVSTGLSSSLDILRETLRQTYTALYNAALEKGLGSPGGPEVLALLGRILAEYSEAVHGSATELELQRVESVTRSLKRSSGLSAKLPGIVNHLGEATLTAQLGREETLTRGETRSRRVRVGRFEESHLTELIGMAHVLIREHAPAWRTLFVLDDFDLLKRDAEGSFAPEALIQALAVLAEIPGFHALTTVRQDTYYRYPKAFHRVTNVAPFVDEGPLVEIYDRHVKLYQGGKSPFKESLVRDAARLARGRPGVFLNHLREAFMNAETDLAQLELADWIEARWEGDRRAEPELAELVTEAALREDGILASQELPRLRQSILMRWVLEDYTSESAARVDPVLLEILRQASPEG